MEYQMVTEHQNKGRILFEEKRIGLKEMWSIILSLYFLLFVLIVVFSKRFDFGVLKLYFGLVFFTSPLIIYPIFQRERMLLYEKGFYAPYDSFHLLIGKRCFIPYEEIRYITPYYRNRLIKGIGFVVITKNGKRTYIPYAKDGDGVGILDALKEILGDRWDGIYSEFPILTEKEMKYLEREVLKSDRRLFSEAFLVMICPLFLFVIGHFLNSLVLKFLGIFLLLFSIPLGVALAFSRNYHIKMVQRMYHRMPKTHPMYSFFAKLSEKRPEIKKKEFLMGNPVEEAKRFTNEDWKRLLSLITENPLKKLASEVLAIALFGVFVFGCFLILWDPLISIFILFFLSTILFIVSSSKGDEAILFLNEVIRYEHEHKERIVPDWFRIENAERKGIMFRDRPEYNDEMWEKLFSHWRIATQKIAISLLLLALFTFFFGMGMSYSLPNRSPCPIISAILLAILLFGLPVLEKYSDAGVVALVLEYENETGERVLPERYREIAYTWLKKAGKLPKRIQKS